MNVVGIDLSLTSTGVAIMDTPLVITPLSKGISRLVDIRDTIMSLLSAVEEPVVMVEGYSFASRNSHAHALGELGGVIRVALYEAGIRYADVPPTSRAKFATGRGNAGKSEVVSAVSARTGIIWSGKGADDMCDAWVLQEMGLAILGTTRHEWPKENMSALDKIAFTEPMEIDT
jgi:crossover junction endodeoxyribonuclease RuvC